MLKFLSLLFIIPALLTGTIKQDDNLFCDEKKVEIYCDGQLMNLSAEQLNEFKILLAEAFESGVEMPALGVMLDDEIKEGLKSGIWVKFIFSCVQIKNEMPYDELLLKIEPDSYGVNIVRGNGGVYSGRCFYYNLQNSLDKVYDFCINKKSSLLQTGVNESKEGENYKKGGVI